MGCTDSKGNSRSADASGMKGISRTVQQLVSAYASIYNYIQQQRQTVLQQLCQQNQLTSQDPQTPCASEEKMISIEDDLTFFKSLRTHVSKFKYDACIQKFLKNIKYSTYKLEEIVALQIECFSELSAVKRTIEGARFIKKHQPVLNELVYSMNAIAKYLDITLKQESQPILMDSSPTGKNSYEIPSCSTAFGSHSGSTIDL